MLNCVQMRRINGDTVWIATNGKQLGVLNGGFGLEFKVQQTEAEAEALAVSGKVVDESNITLLMPNPDFTILRRNAKFPMLEFDMEVEVAGRGLLLETKSVIYHAGLISLKMLEGWGQYPDVYKVIPKGEGKLMPYSHNPELAVNFVKAMRLAYGTKLDGVAIRTHNDPEVNVGAMSVYVSGCPEFYGALMPMNLNVNETQPDWLAKFDLRGTEVTK